MCVNAMNIAPTPYQREIASAVAADALHGRGGLFTAEIPLGAGVSELAAQLDLLMMSVDVAGGGDVLRAAPSEAAAVKDRLVAHLRNGALDGLWAAETGAVRLGRARVHYAPHDKLPALRGPFGFIQVTDAHLLDGAQLGCVVRLAAESGATALLYGRPWNGATPFEQLKADNRRATSAAGGPLHFRVPLERAEAELPGYAGRVAEARERLGESHPEFAAAYELRPIAGPQAFAPEQLRALLSGGLPRRAALGGALAASVVFTRLPEPGLGPLFAPIAPAPAPATAVVTVGERAPGGGLRVVDHKWLEAQDAAGLVRAAARYTSESWECARVVARSTAGRASEQARRLLEKELGARRLIWAAGRPAERSAEVSSLLAAAGTGRLSLYATDCSYEHRMLRNELERAALRPGAGRGLELAIDGGAEGFLEGLALLAHYGAGECAERAAPPPVALAS